MNIFTLTFHRAENYGSVLQAYALNAFLRKMKPEDTVLTIDYQNRIQYNMYRIFSPINSVMDIVRNVHSLLCYSKLKRKHKKFVCFIDDFIPKTDYIQEDSKALEKIAHDADYIVCGSDQIWNLHCNDSDENYLLAFVSDARKKISYAPSLSQFDYTSEEVEVFSRYLSDFNRISVREPQSSDYLKSIINRTPEVVVDPVFLISVEEWSRLSTPPSVSGDYILCYFIGNPEGVRALAKSLSVKYKMPIVIVLKNLRNIGSGYIKRYDAGPRDFLGLIQNARLILCTSFHAVAFYLKFHKQFYVYKGNAKIPNRTKKQIHGKSNLEERILYSDTDAATLTPFDISFEEADKNINMLRQHSIEYLKSALQ